MENRIAFYSFRQLTRCAFFAANEKKRMPKREEQQSQKKNGNPLKTHRTQQRTLKLIHWPQNWLFDAAWQEAHPHKTHRERINSNDALLRYHWITSNKLQHREYADETITFGYKDGKSNKIHITNLYGHVIHFTLTPWISLSLRSILIGLGVARLF